MCTSKCFHHVVLLCIGIVVRFIDFCDDRRFVIVIFSHNVLFRFAKRIIHVIIVQGVVIGLSHLHFRYLHQTVFSHSEHKLITKTYLLLVSRQLLDIEYVNNYIEKRICISKSIFSIYRRYLINNILILISNNIWIF